MTRTGLQAASAALLAAALATTAAADEMDDLARKLNVRPRFHGYKPKFHYTQKTFLFEQARGFLKRTWRIVMDGDRYVALIPDDHIQLLAFTPGTAPTNLLLREGRYHWDNHRGPTLPTGHFIDHKVTYTSLGGSDIARTDHFREGGPTLVLARAFETRQIKVLKRYTFGVHELFGYVVEGRTTAWFKNPPEKREALSEAFCPNSYIPWPSRWVYDRTVYCPGAGYSGYLGWVNNTLAMVRAGRNQKQFTWRDGGFIVFLDGEKGWSPCRTRSDGGPDALMQLDHLRNRVLVTIPLADELPTNEAKWQTYNATHRLFAVPPEITQHLWDNAKLIDVGSRGLVLAVGKTEDFEQQPVSLAEPIRGLAWTGKAPPLTQEQARSGKKALFVGGEWKANDSVIAVQPDTPQVSLRPHAKYLVEAWFKVENMTPEERIGYREKYDAMVAQLKARDEQAKVPAYAEPKRFAEAYVTANLYEWTPEQGRWTARQRTSVARAGTTDWQKVTLEFETGPWDPFVQIAFVCDSGRAFLDDFTLKRIK
jgi:hypothetical protein